MSVDAVVARMGDFLRERAAPDEAAAEAEGGFSANLGRIRGEMNHFLIPLVLLAHADGESVAKEHEVIAGYCLQRLEIEGITVTPEERAAFLAYIRSYKPTRMQLAFAVKKLAAEPKADLLGLVAAAKAVVEADDTEQEGEKRFFDNIERELAAL